MVKRFRIVSTRHNILVEAPPSRSGEQRLKRLRREDPRFRYCRIFEILQGMPSRVKVYHIYEVGDDLSQPPPRPLSRIGGGPAARRIS